MNDDDTPMEHSEDDRPRDPETPCDLGGGRDPAMRGDSGSPEGPKRPEGDQMRPVPPISSPPGSTQPAISTPVDALIKRAPLAYPGRDVPISLFPYPEMDAMLDDSDQVSGDTEFDLPDAPDDLTPPPKPEDLPPSNPNDWPGKAIPETDPVPFGEIVKGEGNAALFVSDFHLSDGAVGDDFLVNHLVSSPPLAIGNTAAGPSRAALFAAVLGFVRKRLAAVGINAFDIVLNGDTIDMLELIGRGSLLSPVHAGFFGTLAAARAAGNQVYYLRGNHDFVVPPGPWIPGVVYANAGLTTLAEHGDFWDPFNWPPGLGNPGSILVTTITAGLETIPTGATLAIPPAAIYELAGLDNVRPFNAGELTAFFQRRIGLATRILFPTVAALVDAATLALRAFGGQADDISGLIGAVVRRLIPGFIGWTQVQGHTHIPVAIPLTYYNTATWTPYIVTAAGNESILERFPFLMVYRNPTTGVRVEEYFIVEVRGGRRLAVLSNRARVNRLRRRLGYRPR